MVPNSAEFSSFRHADRQEIYRKLDKHAESIQDHEEKFLAYDFQTKAQEDKMNRLIDVVEKLAEKIDKHWEMTMTKGDFKERISTIKNLSYGSAAIIMTYFLTKLLEKNF